MTSPPANRTRKLSLSGLKDAVETVAVNQAQIGVAVIALLNDPTTLTPEAQAELVVKMQGSVDELLQLTEDLMELPDGS